MLYTVSAAKAIIKFIFTETANSSQIQFLRLFCPGVSGSDSLFSFPEESVTTHKLSKTPVKTPTKRQGSLLQYVQTSSSASVVPQQPKTEEMCQDWDDFDDELPEEFWENYGTEEPLRKRMHIDSKC